MADCFDKMHLRLLPLLSCKHLCDNITAKATFIGTFFINNKLFNSIFSVSVLLISFLMMV